MTQVGDGVAAGPPQLDPSDRDRLTELAPLLRRCVGLDPSTLARIRLDADTATALVRLPFRVLASRTVTVSDPDAAASSAKDVTVAAAQTLDWLDGARTDAPDNQDAQWRGGAPPRTGWRRLDTVPDQVIRGLVRSGALALKEAAAREGVPDAQPRAAVSDALLDAVVLTIGDAAEATDDVAEAMPGVTITLRPLSALTRMGFLPRGGSAAVDVAGRWVRVAARYGSVYAEKPGSALTLT